MCDQPFEHTNAQLGEMRSASSAGGLPQPITLYPLP
jgi:hypothetical protein